LPLFRMKILSAKQDDLRKLAGLNFLHIKGSIRSF